MTKSHGQRLWPCVLSLWPIVLGAIGHGYARFKAEIIQQGGPWQIVLMNDRTLDAYNIWVFVEEHGYIWIVYGIVLILGSLCAIGAGWVSRVALRFCVSSPGVSYFIMTSYLGGK